MTTVTVGNVEIDDQGIARVGRTRMKVSQIVIERNVWGLSPEEIADGHDTITLVEVFVALAYYADHRADVDAQIAREDARIEQWRQQQQDPRLQERLRQIRQSTNARVL